VGFRNGASGRTEGIHDVNMTPLIDVSLVLVVILMVATPLAFQSSIAVSGGASSGQKAVERGKSERIELEVHADGTVEINRMLVNRESLGAALRPLIQNSVTGLVVVRCDPQVVHGDFVVVLDEARGAGAHHIGVIGR